MFEALVERLDSHRFHALGDQIADRIVHHRSHDAGAHAEAVRQIRGHVELTAADMNLAFGSLAKRDDPRVQPVDQSAERNKV